MDFFGVGPLEILLVLVIALIVMGPKDMAKAGRTIGSFLRRIVTSPTWSTIQDASREIRYLPNKLMREAGLEELRKQLPDTQTIAKDLGYAELHKEARTISSQLSAWTTPPQKAVETTPSGSSSEGTPAESSSNVDPGSPAEHNESQPEQS